MNQPAFEIPGIAPGQTSAFLYDGQLTRGPRQLVMFRWEAEYDRLASASEGRPVYHKKEFVTIQNPGELLQVIDRPATDQDRARWPHQYAAFQRNTAYVPDGTPVELLFATQPNVSAILKSHGIHVVEDLVRVSANAIDTLGMGSQDWVNRGKAYLEMAKQGADFHQIKQMEEKHSREVDSLNNKIADLTRVIDNMRQEMMAAMPQHAMNQMVGAMAQAATPAVAARPMPNLPAKDPKAWNAPDKGLLDPEERREAIKENLRGKRRGGKDVEFSDE